MKRHKLLIGIMAIGALVGAPQTFAAEPFTYGFIRSNVSCLSSPRQKRVRLVSQVFAWCAMEVPSSQVIRDNKVFFHQVARTACESDYTVTYESLVSDRSESQIERDHADATSEQG